MKFSYMKRGAAAAIVAGTLAFAPVAAMAQTAPETPIVNKTWTAASNSQLNNDETFQFKLAFAGATQQGTNELQDFSKFGTKTVDLTSKWLDNAKGGNSAFDQLTAKDLFGDTDFTQPGTYKFTLTEVEGTNPNIDYSKDSYTVTVTVAWPDDYPASKKAEIKSIKLVKTDDKGNKKLDAADFQNTAHANDSLKVSKTVSGTAANVNDTFSYTLKIEGAKGAYDVKKSDGSTAKVKAGEDYAFTLKHGESIEVKNLPEGATYTVKETDTDYTETNKITGKGTSDKNGRDVSGTIVAGTNEVAYKNEKGFAPDSGITMNTLPFVGIGVVAVAGAATLVISRRRRSGEEF